MIGKTISHYKILEKLGEGGMGVVYKAQDTKLDRFVALKFLPEYLHRDEDEKKRFIHEAKAASALDHPHICTIYEIGESEDGQMFIAMACYEGELLTEKISRAPLTLEEALDLATQILSGLERAHNAEIVHRDIKPANIMITDHGEVKILDFGVAKLAGQTKLTKSGTTLGTAAYMSPEQARGEEMDGRSDLFSFGVVLHEMLTGQHPFKGDYEMAVLYEIMNEDPEPITSLRSGLPMPLERAVTKALEKDKALRYQSAADLAADLNKIKMGLVSGEKLATGHVGDKSKKWRRLLIPSIAAVTLAAAFLLLQPIFKEEAPISSPNPIAVMPFENQTGDISLDYLKEVIPNLLITNLEQSRYLNLMTWERMQDLLKVAKKDIQVVDIDKETGFELCKMEGIHAIVVGSFTKAGDVFATDLKVLDVDTKDLLLGISAKGKGVGSILENQIDDLSKGISKGVAVQKQAVKEDFRIADVSTKSIEAYRLYLEGLKSYGRYLWGGAVANFRKAIQLDSGFAMAHFYLAKSYGRLHDSNRQNTTMKTALALSKKTTEKEALYIKTYYAWAIERDEVEGFRLNEELVLKYPKEKQAHNDLGVKYRLAGRIREAIVAFERALELDPYWGNIYNKLGYGYALIGDFDRSESSFQKYVALTKGGSNAFDSMGDFYFITGRLRDAILNYELASESSPLSWSALTQLAFIHAINAEYDKALEQFNKFIGDDPAPGWVAMEHRYRGVLFLYLGRYREALELFQKQKHIVGQIGDEMGEAAGHELASFLYAETGRLDQAASELQLCLKARMRFAPENGHRWRLLHQFLTGLVDVWLGDLAEAKQKLKGAKDVLASAKHKWHEFGTYWCGLLEGEIMLADSQPLQAIQIFKNVNPPNPWYLNWDGVALYRLPIARDGLARAYYAAGNLDHAIAEYRRLLTFNPESEERFLINPKYHYRLAKLYEETEARKLAIMEYQRFLEIWKNADPDLPDLIDARQRLTKLQGTSKKIRK